MNDPFLLKDIIKEREKRYIELNESISKELLDLLVATTTAVADSLFKQGNSKLQEFHKHRIYIKCHDCGQEGATPPLIIEKVKKHIHELRKGIPYRCNSCQTQYDNEEKEKKEETYKKLRRNDTDYYIQNYLSPDKEWKANIKPRDRWKAISTATQWDNYVYLKEIIAHIQNMEYHDFLKTPYWKTVAQHVLYKSEYTCQQCDSKERLVVHHKTYKHHGQEHLYWKEDLICICTKCHEKIHGIKNKEE